MCVHVYYSRSVLTSTAGSARIETAGTRALGR